MNITLHACSKASLIPKSISTMALFLISAGPLYLAIKIIRASTDCRNELKNTMYREKQVRILGSYEEGINGLLANRSARKIQLYGHVLMASRK